MCMYLHVYFYVPVYVGIYPYIHILDNGRNPKADRKSVGTAVVLEATTQG